MLLYCNGARVCVRIGRGQRSKVMGDRAGCTVVVGFRVQVQPQSFIYEAAVAAGVTVPCLLE